MRRTVALALVVLAFAVGCATKDPKLEAAKDAEEARNLVEKARIAVEGMAANPNIGPTFRDMLSKAQGVFVAPDVLRGAFVVGGSGGKGVFLTRSADRSWNGPAFYGVADVSFGFQIGGDSSDIMLLAMTERGVNAFLSTGVKLGGNVGVAAGPVGGGAAAANTDLLSYSVSKGAYAGVSLEGAVINIREDWNRAFYGRDVSTADILIRGSVKSPQSSPLVQSVSKAAAK
jgi:lipid-binding SYLF domain-containing protein